MYQNPPPRDQTRYTNEMCGSSYQLVALSHNSEETVAVDETSI